MNTSIIYNPLSPPPPPWQLQIFYIFILLYFYNISHMMIWYTSYSFSSIQNIFFWSKSFLILTITEYSIKELASFSYKWQESPNSKLFLSEMYFNLLWQMHDSLIVLMSINRQNKNSKHILVKARPSFFFVLFRGVK